MTEGIKVPMTIRDFFFEDPFFKSNWEDFDKIQKRMFQEPRGSWNIFENDFDNMACMSNNIMVKSAADNRQRRSVSNDSERKILNSLERKEASKSRESSVSKESSSKRESSSVRNASSAVRNASADKKVYNVQIEPSGMNNSFEIQKTTDKGSSDMIKSSERRESSAVRNESADRKVYKVQIEPSGVNNSSERQKTPERLLSDSNMSSVRRESSAVRTESSAVRNESADRKVYNVQIEPSNVKNSSERQKTPDRVASEINKFSVKRESSAVRNESSAVRNESADRKVYNVKIKPSERQKTPERKVSFEIDDTLDTKELSKRNVVTEQRDSLDIKNPADRKNSLDTNEISERKLSSDKLESNIALINSSSTKESSTSSVRRSSRSSERKLSNTSEKKSSSNGEYEKVQVLHGENPMDKLERGLIFPRKWMLPSLSILNDFKDMNLFQDSKDTEVIRVKNNDEKMEVSLDTSQYRPDELSVSVARGVVTIEGKHEEKAEDGSKMVSRQFLRKYTLPKGASTEDVISNLSSDGVLVITVNKKKSQQAIDVKIEQN